MRRALIRVARLALAFGIAFSARAEWNPDYAAALARAKAERKIVLVDVRNAADEAHDKFLAQAETEPAMVRAYGAFVRARIDAGTTKPPPDVAALLAQGAPVPSLALVDPAGSLITTWKWFDNASAILNFLNMARRDTKRMLDAFDLRQRGASGDADVLLGDVNLHLVQLARARDLFQRAAGTFQQESQNVKAQESAISALATRYMLRSDDDVLARIRAIAREGTPEVAAFAYLSIGRAYRLHEQTSPAAAAFRDALTAAKERSPEWSAARDELLALGDRFVDTPSRSAASIRIEVPGGPTLSGQTRLSIATKEPLVRVEWYLDGRAVKATTQPPFDAVIDLGKTPRLHSIDAVAFGPDEKAVGRATTRINDRLDELRIYVVSPAAERVAGTVRVEADAYVPPGHELKEVEFFWNDRPIGAVSSPPYRLEFEAPSSFGYLRALGTLDDGSTAEDAHTFNASGFAENFDVHNIAFAATVVDRAGNRVSGLAPGDFRATDGGEKVALAVRQAPDEPATIGIAIDLSASMHRLLLPVMDIGSRLIASAGGNADKTFLVTFDDRPRLLQPLTTNRSLLQSRLLDAYANGGTALADALAFAIQQFAGTTGRRALIIITDGNEGQSTQLASACLEMAKESGVPIYVIVPRESSETEDGRVFRKVLTEMAEVSGGLMFVKPKSADLDGIVKRIADEIRGQYLLSFSGRSDAPGSWRRVRISVPGKTAAVRTISGYYVR